MKKMFLGIIFLIMLVVGCASETKPITNSVENSAEKSDILTLDQALKEASVRIDERIVAGSKIAPLNFNSPYDKFSGYVLDELTANLVDSGKLTIVDRKEVDLIRGEFNFQFSGEVGDDSMQELGRMLGAQSIISGSLTDMGEFHRIVIRVLNVQTASVAVQYRANIVNDKIISALLTGGKTASISRQAPSTAQAPQATVTQPQSQAQIEISFPMIGRWKVTGKDSAVWTGNLVIEEVKGETFSGYFDWYNSRNEFIGKEYFRGAFNSRFKTVEIKGYRVTDPRKLGLGIYEANLSRNGHDFETGTWGGPGSVPGTWEAKWQE